MSSFFGTAREKVVNRVVMIGVEEIRANPQQPRKYFNPEDLERLAESIRQNGILQPLTVRHIASLGNMPGYELISGERRLRSAKLAGLNAVPCIVTEVTEKNSAVLALVENIQRADLSFFEEAAAISHLMDFYGLTQEEVASQLGKAQSTIANKLRLLRFSPEEMDKILAINLTERHARALLKLPNSEQRLSALDVIAREGLNVEKTEQLIEHILAEKAEEQAEQQEHEKIRKRSRLYQDVKLFINTVAKAVDAMRIAGIPVESIKSKSEDGYMEYLVRVPLDPENENLARIVPAESVESEEKPAVSAPSETSENMEQEIVLSLSPSPEEIISTEERPQESELVPALMV